MNSNKFYYSLIAIAIVGGIAFSMIPITPSLAFLIGVFVTALLVNFAGPSTSAVNESDDDDINTTTLYVGNLPYKANEGHVRDLFAEYGNVVNVRLMKDKRTRKRRGFGFVVVDSASADSMIEELNEYVYMERTLKVRIANEPKSQVESSE
ncbi:RNA recognition motif domain-containing protein [Vibrio agarivorans]|uniref:RNA recognition motif domain-containing protein n=1 Tax=Vibrio agarivorans TaxID=153622 RepID=UPI00222E6BA6|nr:RNA-binding protein [Vibrio agarivorans]MDN3661851.1 RNA-binding protein [Vibrio agarivorans]